MPDYTPEQVDDLIIRFEKAADKQIKKAPADLADLSPEFLKPMFTATEVSLMTVAEEVRDLLRKAVLSTNAADRDYLDDVFGRGCNCTRFIRLRDVLARVVLSQMFKNDPRWSQVADKITIIEQILAQRGSFKIPVKVSEPKDLRYPDLVDMYQMGDQVELTPTQGGGSATSFAVEPALPEGLSLDPATGCISGRLKAELPSQAYKVTATNASGAAATTLRFAVTQPPPTSLQYSLAKKRYTVGDALDCAPKIEGGVCSQFSVEPALPQGLVLDAATGRLHGSIMEAVAGSTLQITGSNARGSVSCEIFLEAALPEVDQITKIIETTTPKDCLDLDPGKDDLLTWMVWMVHRVHLNDETLDELDFTNKEMPPASIQPLVAPKLMKALLTNTYLVTLKLANSAIEREQCREFAEALKVSCTLKAVDVSQNDLDAECIKVCASKLVENPKTVLQTWLLGYQLTLGDNIGFSAEQALMQLMKENLTITRLGVSIVDAACRNNIDQYIIRNVDRSRRLARGDAEEEELLVSERGVSALTLRDPPAKPADEALEGNTEFCSVVRAYCAEKCQVPTNEQLQSFARNKGQSVPFAKVSPVVKAFTQKLLSAVVGLKITLADPYGTLTLGTLQEWKEHKGSWTFILKDEEKRLVQHSTSKQPPIRIDGDFVAWMQP